tara:strand:- start:6006 stop:7142 length:1137 start_codon:yes stop_codon:yes gene_type:complete
MRLKYFIIAGESSGDLHGSLLMRHMREIAPDVQFEGIGGNLMLNQGLKSFIDIKKMNVMGFVEVLKKYSFFKSVQVDTLEQIKLGSFDGIILIDYPGFNLRLAKKIKNVFPELPIHYYISPQIWAWKEDRIKIIQNFIDQMIVIFSFEKDWYLKRGVDAEFVGHPFLDIYDNVDKDSVRQKLGLDKNKNYITLFPGSRLQEIKNHLPPMLDAIGDSFFDDFEFLLGKARELDEISLHRLGSMQRVHIVDKNPEDALIACDFAWVGSGSSTLQSVVFNTPFVLLYKTSFLSWLIMKNFIKVKYAGMPNIILDKPLIPELLQENLTTEKIIVETKRFFNDTTYRDNLYNGYKDIMKQLGGPGASNRSANLIINYVKKDVN